MLKKAWYIFWLTICISVSFSKGLTFFPALVYPGADIYITLGGAEESSRLGIDRNRSPYLSIGGQVGSLPCERKIIPSSHPYVWLCKVPISSFLGEQVVSVRAGPFPTSAILGNPARRPVTVLGSADTRTFLSLQIPLDPYYESRPYKAGGYKINQVYKGALINKLSEDAESSYQKYRVGKPEYLTSPINHSLEIFKTKLTNARVFPTNGLKIATDGQVDTQNTQPDVCLNDIIVFEGDGYALDAFDATEEATGRIDPTTMPWTGGAISLSNSSVKYTQIGDTRFETSMLNRIHWSDLTVGKPNPVKVFVIDTAYKTPSGKIDDPFNKDGVAGHGKWIGKIIRAIAGIPESNIFYIPACYNSSGSCDMPLIIQGLCSAADEARQGTKVLVNLSLGAGVGGNFLQDALIFALRSGVTIITSFGNKDQYGICASVTKFVALSGDACHQFPAEWVDTLTENSMPDVKGRLISVAGVRPYVNSWDISGDNRIQFTISNAENAKKIGETLLQSGALSAVNAPTIYAPSLYSIDGVKVSGNSFSTPLVTASIAKWMSLSKNVDKNLPICLGNASPLGGIELSYAQVLKDSLCQ